MNVGQNEMISNTKYVYLLLVVCIVMCCIITKLPWRPIKMKHNGWKDRSTSTYLQPKTLMSSYGDMDDSCPYLDGRTQWLQFTQWVKHDTNQPLNTNVWTLVNGVLADQRGHDRFGPQYRLYNYTVDTHSTQLSSTVTLLRVTITEFDVSHPTTGGASLRINVTSANHIQVCPYKDYFNGTYLACCHVDHHSISGSYDVKVIVHFRAFAAYFTSIVKFQKIWEKRYEVVPIAKTQQFQGYPQCRHIHTLDVSNNYWIRGATDKYDQLVITDYSSSNNCLWPSRMNDAAMTSCFTSILNNTYHVIGDSHVRFTYYYMNMHTGGPAWWEKIHKDIIYEGRVLFWCESCEDMAEGLDRYIQIRKAGNHRKHLLLLDNGAWDLWGERPLQRILLCFWTKIYPRMKVIAELPTTTVVWQGLPPNAIYNLTIARGNWSKNPYLIAAMDYFFHNLLAKINVIFINTYALALPWSENMGKGHAHLMYGEDGAIHPIPPGEVVSQLTMYHVCHRSE